jgi:hypothetical protein
MTQFAKRSFYLFIFFYHRQHRFTLQFAMIVTITVDNNKMVAVINAAYYYHIHIIFCTMLPLLQ